MLIYWSPYFRCWSGSNTLHHLASSGEGSFFLIILNDCHQWFRRWGMGGSGATTPPHTYVQTPPDISANPLKSFFIYSGIPCMYIAFFTAHQQRKMVRTPTFFGLATPLRIADHFWWFLNHMWFKKIKLRHYRNKWLTLQISEFHNTE